MVPLLQPVITSAVPSASMSKLARAVTCTNVFAGWKKDYVHSEPGAGGIP